MAEKDLCSLEKRHFLAAAAAFFFALALYGNTLLHGYVLDDNVYFINHAYVQQGFGGIGKILTTETGTGAGARHFTYRPLVLVMFAVEKALFGNNPAVGHGLNVFLYALACGLLCLLLAKVLADGSLSVPLGVALLFAAHPVHVEVVANIKSRDEILCFLFLLGLLWNLQRHAVQPKVWRLGLSLLFFALALLTKEHAITFVALVPLTLHFFSTRPLQAIVKTTALYAAVAGSYLLLRAAVVGAVLMPVDDGLMNVLTVAHGVSESLGTRLLILWNYLRLLIFPLRLSWDYSYNIVPVTSLAAPQALAAGLAFCALIAVGLRGLRRRSVVSFGVLFFLVTFSVVSNVFLLLRWTMAERFLFTPSLGVCLAAVVGLRDVVGRSRGSASARRATLLLLLCPVVVLFAARTFVRNRDWNSGFDLYLQDAATYPQGALIHGTLGIAYLKLAAQNGDPAQRETLLRKAREEYQRSISIYPDDYRRHEGLAYVNSVLGDFIEAERAARRALELFPFSPESTFQLAFALLNQGRYEEAEVRFKRTLQLSPFHPKVDMNLATVYARLERPLETVHHLREAARKDPADPEPLVHLAAFYRRGGDIGQARAAYAKALALRPDTRVQLLLEELEQAAPPGALK